MQLVLESAKKEALFKGGHEKSIPHERWHEYKTLKLKNIMQIFYSRCCRFTILDNDDDNDNEDKKIDKKTIRNWWDIGEESRVGKWALGWEKNEWDRSSPLMHDVSLPSRHSLSLPSFPTLSLPFWHFTDRPAAYSNTQRAIL